MILFLCNEMKWFVVSIAYVYVYMRNIFIFILAVVFFSCKKEKGCPATDYVYEYKQNAKIDTTSQYGQFFAFISSGNRLVFNYEMIGTECPDKIDGGAGDILVFEVITGTDSFSYTTSDFQNIKCYDRPICALCETNSFIPSSGTIEGRRIGNGTWQVNASLVLTNNRQLNFSNIFISN